MRFALQHDASTAVKLAAVGSWGCLLQMLVGQHGPRNSSGSSSSSGGDQALRCAAAGVGDAGAAAGDEAKLAGNSISAGVGFAAWLASTVQQQQQCEAAGSLALVFDVIVKPIVEGIMGSNPDSSSRKKQSSSSKPAKDSSCLAGLPVVQLVLQQLLQLAPAPAAASGKQSSHTAAAAGVVVKAEPGTASSAAAVEPPVAVQVCRLVRDTICGSKPAAAVLAAAAAGLAAAAADGAAAAVAEQSPSSSAAACKTPAPAAAAAAAADSGDGKSACKCAHMSTPPPTPLLSLHTPLALAAAAAGGTPATPAFGMRRLARPEQQGQQQLQQQGVLQLQQGMGVAMCVTAVEIAAPPGVQARPDWVLQTAPGWLQLLTVCFKQLLQQQQGEGAGVLTEEQLLLLQQEWLPAWEHLLMLTGAAIQLQLQQQQQQLVAVQAAVQVVHTVFSTLKVRHFHLVLYCSTCHTANHNKVLARCMLYCDQANWRDHMFLPMCAHCSPSCCLH
jgi:hypothetical protein